MFKSNNNMRFNVIYASCVVFAGLLQTVRSQAIDGCPMFGCRPSGSFSFTLSVPRANASIGWVADLRMGPVPDYGGCVGNPNNLVCQSNGPGPGHTGYVSVDISTGEAKWRDFVLRFPSLPVLDADGDLWGSDGSSLMRYDVNGKPEMSIVHLDPNMRPLFGTQYVGEGIILLVSETGQIATWLSDGTPLASIYLKASVQRSNGTFLPVAPAVVNDNRIYVLTEFAPDDGMETIEDLGLQRLYAIDVHQSMTERMAVAWYANFEKELSSPSTETLRYIPKSLSQYLMSKLSDPSVKKPSILFDKMANTVYVSLPPPMLSVWKQHDANLEIDRLLGVKDMGNDSSLAFKASQSAVNMVLYESNNDHSTPPTNAGNQLWISTQDCKLVAIGKLGDVSKVINVNELLETNCTITSKITTARSREVDEDFLVFGVHVSEPSQQFSQIASSFNVDGSMATPKNYVIGIDTPENDIKNGMPLSFMVPTPDDTSVFGQVIGIPDSDNDGKDQLVVFSQIEGEFGKIFTIS